MESGPISGGNRPEMAGPLSSRVAVIRDGDSARVVLGGEFDIPEAEHLLTELQPIIVAPPPLVVMELVEVEFMCSRIIGVLERLRLAVTSAGGQFQLGPRRPIVERLLAVSGFFDA